MIKETPPTDDPSLPSYQCPMFLKFAKWRQILGDCYEGDFQSDELLGRYLPMEQNEPPKAYRQRCEETTFENHVAETVEGFAGAISSMAWVDKPSWLEQLEEDFDLAGNSLSVVIDRADIKSLLEGFCFLLVDFQRPTLPEGVEPTRDFELKNPARPFVRIVSATACPNLREEQGDVVAIAIVERQEAPDKYGTKETPIYRVIRGDRWQEIELVKAEQPDKDGRPTWLEIVRKEGQYMNAKGQPLGYCPVVAYCPGGEQWRSGVPPEFMSLARHNIDLYQASSDYRTIVRSLAPTPWIRASIDAKLSGDGDGCISLGPHDWIHLGNEPHAQCGLLQGNPDAVAPARQRVLDVRHLIYSLGLSLKSSADGEAVVTATEVRTRFLGIQKRLTRLAEGKQSALNVVGAILADYLGISEYPKAQVTADISALLNSVESVVLLYNAQLLSKDAAVLRLEQLGYNDDAALELERLSESEQLLTKELANRMAISAEL